MTAPCNGGAQAVIALDIGLGLTAQGQRVGLVARHPASHVDELAPTLELDEALILRRFKHDAAAFGQAKEAFLAGLNQFPTSL